MMAPSSFFWVKDLVILRSSLSEAPNSNKFNSPPEPRGGDIGMPEPLLHLGDVGLVVERVGGRRGPVAFPPLPCTHRCNTPRRG
jgi:hypothetical protein